MKNIKRKARTLIKVWGTANPFKLAEYLKIIIIYADLGEIKGYSIKRLRKKLICINENLSDFDKMIVCAHELGHCCCHDISDMAFLLNHTHLIKKSILENEANIFAKELLKNFDEYVYNSKISLDVLEGIKNI
ncbi:ImmA/IrrE family metallo-endopeptidase [Fusobacterium sp. FSA-380-WT-3A]|uniref:ImmA/IrrE family metallo-endopeptidase n=1 Tax=Fusobacterium sp. FSA-380-WT-3A TaxID=2725304 RepID=UPI001476DB53|nr:ImmA/IrrE family metallo-endopeptidase [Fusobacterium sp. FSA-380-WT-3A]NME36509.1 ImmA/IrrE family metallo-endopeptidase [Fusobacterium sp. FSA-380-WT-3A]